MTRPLAYTTPYKEYSKPLPDCGIGKLIPIVRWRGEMRYRILYRLGLYERDLVSYYGYRKYWYRVRWWKLGVWRSR